MRWLTVSLLALLLVPATHATSLQARLIRATNDSAEADKRLQDIEKDLKKKFGYEHYLLIGNQPAALEAKAQQRLDLGEGFVVFVTPKSIDKNVHEMDLEWYSGRLSLVKTTVRIPARSSLFVKGPDVGKDWIVLALTIAE